MAGLTNSILTQIANKRIAGKAMVSGKNNILQEELGSFVQQTNTTIFATALPNNPSRTLHLIQSASGQSVGNGSVVYTEFDLIEVPGSKYQNSSGTDNNANGAEEEVFDFDLGDTTAAGNTFTFHALQLKLPSGFQGNNPGFDTHAATGTSLGSDPFSNSFAATGSNAFQIVPEYVSTVVGESNPYKPRILDHNDDGVSTYIQDNNDIAFYLDTAAGILFVQNPAYEALANETNNPKKVRAFLYVGKYQSEIDGGDTVSLAFQGDDSSFSVANNATASFQSGSSETISITAAGTTLSFDVSSTFSSSLVTQIDHATGSISELVSSASFGLYLQSGSSLTGSSLSLGTTASFSASGGGIDLTFNSTSNTFEFVVPKTAATASTVNITDENSENTHFGLVFAETTGSGITLKTDQDRAANQGGFGLTYNPSEGVLELGSVASNALRLSKDAIEANRGGGGSSFSMFTADSANVNTLNFGTDVGTINIGTGSGTVFFKGSASIDGDLIVKGTTTTLNTTNLNVEDRFILLNSGTLGSAPTNEGGIIVETSNQKGTAFYYDGEQDRWLVTSASAHAGSITSIGADITAGTNTAAAVVTVQYDAGTPSHTPFVGANAGTADFALGQMYVDNSEDDPCDSNIWIYS